MSYDATEEGCVQDQMWKGTMKRNWSFLASVMELVQRLILRIEDFLCRVYFLCKVVLLRMVDLLGLIYFIFCKSALVCHLVNALCLLFFLFFFLVNQLWV